MDVWQVELIVGRLSYHEFLVTQCTHAHYLNVAKARFQHTLMAFISLALFTVLTPSVNASC